MEANKILQADMLDLLFDGRNKDYGAYELRKKYDMRMATALGITGALLLAIIGGSVMAKSFKGSTVNSTSTIHEVVIDNVKEKPMETPPPPPPPKTQQPQVASVRLTTPVIKPNEEVKTEMPPIEEQVDKKIGLVTQDGILDDGTTTMPTVDNNKGVVEEPKFNPEDKFEKVEIGATVDYKQWKRHLETQLQPFMEEASSQGMAPGQYTVQVRFLVERDGSITEVHALNDPGYGLAKGAEDVVRKGPKWNPGEQNGRKVRSYHTQPITFIVPES